MDDLAQYEMWQRAIGRQSTTRETTRKVLTRFLEQAGCLPHEFTTDHVVSFLANEDFSANTRYAYHWHLKTFSDWLVLTKRRQDSPMLGLPSPRLRKRPPRPVSGDSLPVILRHAPTGRVRMMVLLAALQGLRVHEVAKVHSRDVDLHDGTIEVLGKGGKVAILPLHDDVRSAIRSEQMTTNGYWFESRTRPGKPIQPASVSKAVSNAMALAGVSGTPHALRHYFGTQLVRSGANLRVVQELMRHSSINTTQGYIEVQGSEMRAALGNLRIAS